MSIFLRICSIATVLGIAVNAAWLTRAVILDRPAFAIIASTVGLTVCVISTLIQVLIKR